MREDDLVCTVCYKRLPKDMQQKLWRYKYSDFPVSSGDYSIVTDWLLDHELAEDLTCPDREEQMSEFRLEDLQDEVAKILIGNYDYDANEAEEAIREACSDEPEMWNENADASELAKHVADPEDDE